ncbi:MAG: FeoA family protein [Blautia sp.]|jgi:ferrous iron transport protein A
MKLNETPIEQDFIIVRVQEEERLLRRLEALGILEGTRVHVLNRKRNGATIIKVRGSRWALGNDIAQGIEVEETKDEG